MSETGITITLIGSKLASVGNEFIFRGAAGDCEKCKLKNVCINLEKNKKYRIVGLRNGMEHECSIHEGTVRAVEVVPCPIIVNIESRKAFNGSKLVFEEPECNKACTLFEQCHPQGLRSGDRYTIAEVFDSNPGPCEKGLTLKKVELRP